MQVKQPPRPWRTTLANAPANKCPALLPPPTSILRPKMRVIRGKVRLDRGRFCVQPKRPYDPISRLCVGDEGTRP